MNLMESKYSILVNTCDKFEDCWEPFFKLWATYWPQCRGKIFLNTEYKNYNNEFVKVTPLKVCEQNNVDKVTKTTWSQCLRWALDSIDSDIILYMQEDYFLKAPVKNELVEKYVKLMEDNCKISCIHLTDQAVLNGKESNFENLDNVLLKQRYRVSCQAALWRKKELIRLIREYEDAWEFEEFGSMRSAIFKSNYYVVKKEYVKLNHFEIIPYVFTGIVRGRWFEEIIPLFEKHQIFVDYSIRGFLKDAPPKPFKQRINYRFKKMFKILKNAKELSKLKRLIR